MANLAKVKIDPGKMAVAIAKAGYVHTSDISKELGFANGTIGNAINRGTLTRAMWKLISDKTGIALEDVQDDTESDATTVSGTVYFDPEKFRSIAASENLYKLSTDLGYSSQSTVIRAVKRGYMNAVMWALVSDKLGIKLEDVQSDPELKAINDVPEVSVPDPVLDPNDVESRFSFFNDEELEVLNMFKGKLDEVIGLLKHQPQMITEETIALGVGIGLETFWSGHKKEIVDMMLKNVRGAIFAGNLEALKKHDEILDERFPYREFIAPVENGRPD